MCSSVPPWLLLLMGSEQRSQGLKDENKAVISILMIGQFQYIKILSNIIYGSQFYSAKQKNHIEVEVRMGDSRKYPCSTTFQFFHLTPLSLSAILEYKGRQRGRVARVLDLKSVGRGFKSRSDP